jgi:hypothetical protein
MTARDRNYSIDHVRQRLKERYDMELDNFDELEGLVKDAVDSGTYRKRVEYKKKKKVLYIQYIVEVEYLGRKILATYETHRGLTTILPWRA